MTTTLLLALSAVAFAQEGGPIDVAVADFACTSSGGLVGVPPMDVTCEVVLSDLFTYDDASWLFGDGTTGSGDQVTHTYDEAGQFSISLSLEGLRYAVDDTGPDPVLEPTAQKFGLVTACGPAFAEFEVQDRGGLRFQLVNQSSFLVNCVDDVQWTVYRGRERRPTLLLEASGWGPLFELPEEGTYTFFLDIFGPGGDSAAKFTIDAKDGFDERLKGSPTYCATSPMAGSLGWMGLLLLWRRRR